MENADGPVFEAPPLARAGGAVASLLDAAVLAAFLWIAVDWLRDLGQGDWTAVALRALFLLVIGLLLWQRVVGILARLKAMRAGGVGLRIGPEGLVVPGRAGAMRIPWRLVQSVAIDTGQGRLRVDHGPEGAAERSDVSLQHLSEAERARALAVLRHHWPETEADGETQETRRRP